MLVIAVLAYIIALNPNSSIMGLVSNARRVWAPPLAPYGAVVPVLETDELQEQWLSIVYKCADSDCVGLYSAGGRTDSRQRDRPVFSGHWVLC